MAMLMPPPSLGGFSLRVQLFSPDAHTLNDRPLRAFRVVISPDVTIRDFCKEASRIHEINYGVPLAIKKCQDDQEFDITQTEIIGVLFANTSTIRVIQTSATPSIRDSVPPDSALRFNPGTNGSSKRRREGSLQPNGTSPSGAYKPNKRQRVVELDPDLPLPSRETELEPAISFQQPRLEVPDSQGDKILGRSNKTRDVRASIPETPPPESHRNTFADEQYSKNPSPYKVRRAESETSQTRRRNSSNDTAQPSKNVSPYEKLLAGVDIPPAKRRSPFNASPQHSQPPRSKSASYHIPRSTERGVSVSTAATSPLSVELQPIQSGTESSLKHRPFDQTKDRTMGGSHSSNEENIYEIIESDGETAASVMKKTKANLRLRNSPQNGLHGLEWASQFSTPPNGNRRNSRPHEQASELPLTPSSRERQEIQRQSTQTDEVKEARKAAAEQRKREADEARLVEEAEADKLRRAEKEIVFAKAARIEEERLEKLEGSKTLEGHGRGTSRATRQEELQTREIAEAQRVKAANDARIRKERVEAERFQEEENLRKERGAAAAAESARLAKEIAAKAERAREAERLRKEKEAAAAESAKLLKVKAAVAAEEVRKAEEKEAEALRRKTSASVEHSDRSKGTTPARQTSVRPQSSTPFIPSGKKSSLKSSNSSHSGSSPVATRNSPSGSLNSAMKDRRVSFDENITRYDVPTITPIPPPIARSRAANAAKHATSKPATPKPTKISVPPAKVTPVPPPPSIMARFSKDRSTTPQRQTLTPQALKAASKSTTPEVSQATPKVVVKSASPIPPPSARQNKTPNGSRVVREPYKAVEPPQATEEQSSDDEEEDIPSRVTNGLDSVSLLNNTINPRRQVALPKNSDPLPEDQDDEDEDDEMASNTSSPIDSRSPVIFNYNTPPQIPELPPLPKPAHPIDDEETQSLDDSLAEEVDEEDPEDDLDESEPEDLHPAKPTIQVPQSSPDLPRTNTATKSLLAPPNARAASQRQVPKQRKMFPTYTSPSSIDSGFNTQDEVDFQLTSSLYEARFQSSQPVRSTPVLPSSSQVIQPSFTVGASLQSLNKKKPAIESSVSKSLMKPTLHEDESSEEDEDSDSDSGSDSGSEEETVPSRFIDQKSQVKKAALSSSESSSEDDDDEELDDIAVHRAELVSVIANAEKQYSHSSPNSIRGPAGRLASHSSSQNQSQSRKAGHELKTKKISDKYLTGYSFSQPGY